MLKTRLSPFVAAAMACVPSLSSAAVSLGVVQVYDAAGADNVDTNASGNAIGSALPNDLAGFTVNVASAFTTNTGGVIDFGTSGVGNVGQMNITYGGTKTFAINSTLIYHPDATASQNIDIRDNLGTLSPISGTTALLANVGTGNTGWALSFGAIANGSPQEAITTMAFTLLSRSGSSQTAAVSWFVDGSSTPIVTDAEAIANSNGGDNTFFSYTAAAGSAITGFRIDYGGALSTNDRRLGIDDIGFITGIVPEPGSILLVGLASLTGLLRRRR